MYSTSQNPALPHWGSPQLLCKHSTVHNHSYYQHQNTFRVLNTSPHTLQTPLTAWKSFRALICSAALRWLRPLHPYTLRSPPALTSPGREMPGIWARAGPSKHHHLKVTNLSTSWTNQLTCDPWRRQPKSYFGLHCLCCMPRTHTGSAVTAAFVVLFFQAYKPSFSSSGLGNASMYKRAWQQPEPRLGVNKYVCRNKADVPGNLATKNKISARAKGEA